MYGWMYRNYGCMGGVTQSGQGVVIHSPTTRAFFPLSFFLESILTFGEFSLFPCYRYYTEYVRMYVPGTYQQMHNFEPACLYLPSVYLSAPACRLAFVCSISCMYGWMDIDVVCHNLLFNTQTGRINHPKPAS